MPYGEFHHKQQTLTYEKGYAVRALLTHSNENVDSHPPEMPVDYSSAGKEATAPPVSHDAASKLPKWVEYDRKVCASPVDDIEDIWTTCTVNLFCIAVGGLSRSNLKKLLRWGCQVLRWFAYFKESVIESAQEQYRIRRITILYYLEDDTLEVTEPKQENSGILQVLSMSRSEARAHSHSCYWVSILVIMLCCCRGGL